MKKGTQTLIGGLLVAGGLLAAALAFWQGGPSAPAPTPDPTATPLPTADPVPVGTPEPDPAATPDQVDGLPVGKLVITPERKAYVEDSLTLYIPAIQITRKVHDGTDAATLNRGVGLYEYAQLPGEGNRNVSLAGHRNGLSNGKITDRAPFYYIDTLAKGDYLYLYDSEHIYRYLWESCEIVEPDDWGPIRTTGYSCITITSCHPIGISDHRIIVRGVLDEILAYDPDYEFPAHMEEVSQ
jgi:LPXTG-site transpeptidase (sortase) family protein